MARHVLILSLNMLKSVLLLLVMYDTSVICDHGDIINRNFSSIYQNKDQVQIELFYSIQDSGTFITEINSTTIFT